jgi:hypothetical protein
MSGSESDEDDRENFLLEFAFGNVDKDGTGLDYLGEVRSLRSELKSKC